MNFRRTPRSRLVDTLLDVTPLIDVVFLLLIFFMITTTFTRTKESVLSINLPRGAAEDLPPDPEQLTVFVSSGGRFHLSVGEGERGHPTDFEQLENELVTVYQTNPDILIYLRGDRGANYGHIIDVLQLVREIGFQRVQAVIREEGSAPAE